MWLLRLKSQSVLETSAELDLKLIFINKWKICFVFLITSLKYIQILPFYFVTLYVLVNLSTPQLVLFKVLILDSRKLYVVLVNLNLS